MQCSEVFSFRNDRKGLVIRIINKTVTLVFADETEPVYRQHNHLRAQPRCREKRLVETTKTWDKICDLLQLTSIFRIDIIEPENVSFT